MRVYRIIETQTHLFICQYAPKVTYFSKKWAYIGRYYETLEQAKAALEIIKQAENYPKVVYEEQT